MILDMNVYIHGHSSVRRRTRCRNMCTLLTHAVLVLLTELAFNVSTCQSFVSFTRHSRQRSSIYPSEVFRDSYQSYALFYYQSSYRYGNRISLYFQSNNVILGEVERDQCVSKDSLYGQLRSQSHIQFNSAQSSDKDIPARYQQAGSVATTIVAGNQNEKQLSNESRSKILGEHQDGSATRCRKSKRPTSEGVDTLQKYSATRKSDKRYKPSGNESNHAGFGRNQSIASQSRIHSVIEDIFRKQAAQDTLPSMDSDSKISSAFANFGRTIGLLGETAQRHVLKNLFKPGSVILQSSNCEDVTVRMATPFDDVDIANLRLSVFSDFSPDLHSKFCARSCQAIAARRIRGALCVVAIVPQKGNVGSRSSIIVGTAECSFHEFFGTQLGRRRPSNSILYVTEVAVNPNVRRKGIGTKLLQAITKLAIARGIESLYLHVDVNNHGAIKLYDKCGYQKVDCDHPMYFEFTRSLNLHPGATKGRDHHLLCRNLRSDPTWLDDRRQSNQRLELVGALGFEIPA